jgi:lipoprotein-releasing system ATP-binding protein
MLFMLKSKGITKSYGSLQVLKGIDLEVQKGEIISIVGASGAGKSTLLHILGTLDQADQGDVWIEDKNISKMNARQIALFRNLQIGFVFQFHNLLPEFTAFENICLPGFIAKRPDKEVRREGLRLMEMLGIQDRQDNKPSQLSGGEQQRAAVARALVNNPALVFADEPSGNLDSKNASELHDLFFNLRDSLGQTFVIVTHNNELARKADRSLEIRDGIILNE